MQRIYLDYAASTPVDPEVLKAMLPYFAETYGNPSSAHAFGQAAMAGMDKARAQVARAFSCLTQEVIFTGSATEANNMAVFGVIREAGKTRKKMHIVSSVIEHKSMREPLKAVEKEYGAEITWAPVTKEGIVRPEDVKNALRDDTVLVSIMYANNEIGSIQPLFEISEVIKDFRKSKSAIRNPQSAVEYPLFHTDAVQAANYLPLDVSALGVDLLTLSGHKFYAPKGVGVLYIRKGASVAPLLYGSGQEYGKRSGTENIASIVGFGVALEYAVRERENESRRTAELRDYFIGEVTKRISSASVNGGMTRRLANNANMLFRGMPSQELLMRLDMEGVAASAGSACQSKAISESHVLGAIGLSQKDAKSSVRFSMGRSTTKDEIDRAVSILVKLVK